MGKWLENFEDELTLQNVETEEQKLVCLKRYGGDLIKQLIRDLPASEADELWVIRNLQNQRGN